MIQKRLYLLAIQILSVLIYCPSIWGQQDKDVLTLQKAIVRTLNTYPTVQQAEEAVRTAQIQTKLTESVYLPSLSGVVSYLFMNPISKLNMNNQIIHIQSNHNADFGLSLNQLIWDFGKSKSNIDAARMREEVAMLEQLQTMQSLTLQTISTFYMTAYARQSIDIKERQLEDYEKLVVQIEVKRHSGTATNFDYLNTNSEYNAGNTEIRALKTAKEKQYVSLSLLADTIINDETQLPMLFERIHEARSLQELIDFALNNRIEMQLMHKNHSIAIKEMETNVRSYNPSLSVAASAGFKNGYEPSLGEMRFNYSAGAILHFPMYASGRSKNERNLGKLEVEKALTVLELAY